MGKIFYHHIDKLRKRIDSIIQERPSHKEILEFLRAVMTEQYKIRPRIKTDTAKMCKGKVKGLNEGFPLLDKKEVSLDLVLAASCSKEYAKL